MVERRLYPLKGLMKVKKTLASGKTIYYCYAWRKGPLLKSKKGEPMQPDDVACMRRLTSPTIFGATRAKKRFTV